jgi:alpha-tubulin suppressor-like RCC1 family protein
MEREAESIRGAKSVSCGPSHSCAILADDTAMCWGNNGYGALGNGSEKTPDGPVKVVGLADVAEIGLFFGRTCARTNKGDVTCWGDSEFGMAGDGRLPDNVGREKTAPGKPILSGARTLAVGANHALSIMSDGRVMCWGQNNSGSCGLPSTTRYAPRPVAVPMFKDVVAITAGEAVTCAINKKDEVVCVGRTNNDAPYSGATVTTHLPDKPLELAIGIGPFFCARTERGDVYCWGTNDNGRLGDGTNTDRKTPAKVSLPHSLAIAADMESACALVDGGHVFCWGKDVIRHEHGGSDDALTPLEMK